MEQWKTGVSHLGCRHEGHIYPLATHFTAHQLPEVEPWCPELIVGKEVAQGDGALKSKTAWICTPALSFFNSVTLGKLFNLTVTQVCHLSMEMIIWTSQGCSED